MLTRLYIDNYRCLVNFDLRLGPEHLFLGRNGTGKSTVFDVLWMLRNFLVDDVTTVALCPPSSLTRWEDRKRQTFGLELESNGHHHAYRLELDRRGEDPRAEVAVETLDVDGQPVLHSKDGKASLYDGRGGEQQVVVSGSRTTLQESLEKRFGLIAEFRKAIDAIWLLRPDPRHMIARADEEKPFLAPDLSNFSSWYRWAVQERTEEMGGGARQDLRSTLLDGFKRLHRASRQGVRYLQAEWEIPGHYEPVAFDLDELSEGQRTLIALYVVLHFLKGTHTTLLLDEPDNFLALSEIQPFLNVLSEEEGIQKLFISHHPEVIDQKARAHGLLFERLQGGPVRTSPFSVPDTGLTASEWIARGWDSGQ